MERKGHSYIDVYVHFEDLDAKLQEFIIKRNELSMLAKEFADVVYGDLYKSNWLEKKRPASNGGSGIRVSSPVAYRIP